jgi:hypothetical protein
LKGDYVPAGKSVLGLWIDNITTADTDVIHNFCTEGRRLKNRSDPAVVNYESQATISSGSWDSQQNLISGSIGYSDGLLCYSNSCRYPTRGFDSGDFRNIADGNANGPDAGPAGNPDYSSASGTREYTLSFTNNSGLTRANFKIRFEGTGTFTPDDAIGSGFSVLIKFPDGSISSGTGWMDAYKDFATGQFDDGDGIRNATLGVGRAMNTDWGFTVGTKSIAANEKIVLVVRAAASNSGNITKATLTWL